MENRTPERFRRRLLTSDEYCANLVRLARHGFKAVSFTGGEPTLSPFLPRLVEASSTVYDRVELTTNGHRLRAILPHIQQAVARVKVSLDALDVSLFTRLTQGTAADFAAALDAITSSSEAGIPVSINVVLMRSTLSQISPLADLCRTLNDRHRRGRVSISLLDFYFSPERRDVWTAEFVPPDLIERLLTRDFGAPRCEAKFGCRFLWFSDGCVDIRLKDSVRATYRTPRCLQCRHYCQEGIFALNHSAEGWLTVCPSNEEADGVYLSPGLSDQDADVEIEHLVDVLNTAYADSHSFDRMLACHGLTTTSVPKP